MLLFLGNIYILDKIDELELLFLFHFSNFSNFLDLIFQYITKKTKIAKDIQFRIRSLMNISQIVSN